MSGLKSFQPTDLLLIPAGATVLQTLMRAGYNDLIRDEVMLEKVLAHNRISMKQAFMKLQQDVEVYLNHPTFYSSHGEESFYLAPHRNHSISLMMKASCNLPQTLGHNLAKLKNSACRILDIGCGNGRALLETSQHLPMGQFYGIGLCNGEEGFFGNESLPKTAMLFGLSYQRHKFDIFFQDISNGVLPWGENFFDLIYSQSCMRYIKEKALLIESILRVLSAGGVAYLDLQLMTIIDQNGSAVALEDFFKSIPGLLYDPSHQMLFVEKTQQLTPKLDLRIYKSEWIDWSAEEENVSTVGWHTTYVWNSSSP